MSIFFTVISGMVFGVSQRFEQQTRTNAQTSVKYIFGQNKDESISDLKQIYREPKASV